MNIPHNIEGETFLFKSNCVLTMLTMCAELLIISATQFLFSIRFYSRNNMTLGHSCSDSLLIKPFVLSYFVAFSYPPLKTGSKQRPKVPPKPKNINRVPPTRAVSDPISVKNVKSLKTTTTSQDDIKTDNGNENSQVG